MVTPETIAAYLARTTLFELLDDAQRQSIAREMREAHFAAGELLFGRGDPGREIYLVLEGRVRLSILSVEGREVSFVQAGPGALFGEIAALDGGPRTADATAVNPVRAVLLSHAALKRLITAHSSVAAGAIKLLCARLRDATDQLESIALYPIEVRLARYLLSAARQLRPQSPSKSARVTIELGMSQGDLALFLGASRPKVNVALSALEASGAIERQGTAIAIDIAALEQLVGAE